ncbi:oligosaccharide flippase family protein [Methanomicrobium antiquum]|uniref:Oligosaccharide flippase family protein n=1 Tax=Methanomicrobium antiquum TaxID=487686 RepID=A0AAF0JNB7_9EURY|nr:oligosaccharide flippase family protein [Methanomicrobium antiquum]WFN37405.1 oligosaccharide flippase family protein [Methanomicrobium antiquum]
MSKLVNKIIKIIEEIPLASRIFSYILKNPLYKGVLVLGSGTAIAQIIGIITMPVITRLYTPDDLGVLAVYSSILAIVGIGATLRYEFAYALPKEDNDAANLFGLCLIILFITTIILGFLLFFGRELLVNFFDMSIIEPYILFLIIGFIGMGLYTTLNYWAIRQRDYKRITYTKVNQGASGSVCKIILGIVSFGPMGLILGHIVSQIAGIGTLARSMWIKDKENLKSISFSGMKSVAKRYKSFPIYNFPASIVNTISLQMPPLALLILYNSEIVGYYALAHMLMVLPGSVISQSMGQAYLGEASKMVREKSPELRSLYVRTLKHLSIIAIPLIGIPALFAPFLVPIIFGEAWVEAGWYCWPLALFVVMQFIVSPISQMLIFGLNYINLLWDIIRLSSIFGIFYVSYELNFSVILTLILYSVMMTLMYCLLVLFNIYAIKVLSMKKRYK